MAVKPITTKVAKPETLKTTEPSFAEISADLAVADLKARSLTADAGQAKAERSVMAVGTIKAAFNETISGNDVRTSLLAAGVLKGTVSKIVTVLNALYAGELGTGDIKSLNGAYSLVKLLAKAAATGAAPGVKSAITPGDALKIIVATIKAEKDPDKQLTLAGEWITRVTNAITAAVKDGEDDEEEE